MKTYILYGKPIPLQRPRVTSFGTYDPQKKEKGEARALIYNQRGTTVPATNVPIQLVVTFFMPIPKSTPKKINLKGKFHYKRPDIDNLIKYILDVIQPILITDDSLVATIIADKIYDENPRTQFIISEIEDELD